MEVFVVLFSLVTILAGLSVLIMLIAANIIGKNIREITYSPRSENETEYGLRTLLFMYPNATIHTPHNEISKRLETCETRIITHQEI